MRGAVNGLVLVGLAEGVLLGIAYAVAGLSHATSLGFATGVLGSIPFAAPLIFIGCSLFLLVQGNTTAAIALVVFGSVVAFAADHFARPALIGNTTRLPFLWVLLGILGGLESFGLIGLFLGPAIISVLIAIWREAAALESTSEDARRSETRNTHNTAQLQIHSRRFWNDTGREVVTFSCGHGVGVTARMQRAGGRGAS